MALLSFCPSFRFCHYSLGRFLGCEKGVGGRERTEQWQGPTEPFRPALSPLARLASTARVCIFDTILIIVFSFYTIVSGVICVIEGTYYLYSTDEFGISDWMGSLRSSKLIGSLLMIAVGIMGISCTEFANQTKTRIRRKKWLSHSKCV